MRDQQVIRLLSFQNAHNYGAVLQAYGLQQTILSFGYKNVKFINYNPEYLQQRYRTFKGKCQSNPQLTLTDRLKRFFAFPFSAFNSIKRNREFKKSISLLLDQTDITIINKAGLVNEIADILICGSDQIWNTSLTGSFDPVFFAQGEYARLGYAASYAPSTELSSLTEEKAIELSKLLCGFKYISVREEPIKNVLNKYTDRDISVCIDPTLLCGPDKFKLVASSRKVKNDYILIYAYDISENQIDRIVKTIPYYQRYQKHIILFGAGSIKSFFRSGIHGSLSVEDFLSYFLYASYVVTTSFHGLAFSLLFEKNFNVVCVEGKFVRCKSLLAELDLLSRFVDSQSSHISWDSIDYSITNKIIEKLRCSSVHYLKTILEA